MDINTNVSQQTVTSLPVLKAENARAAVDSPVQAVNEVSKIRDFRLATSKAMPDDKSKPANDEDLKQAVDELNGYVQNMQRNLQFSLDKESGTMVVKVIDANSEKVIRQMPTEETLKLARHLAEDKQDAAINIFSSRA